jgi:hypothetical protein
LRLIAKLARSVLGSPNWQTLAFHRARPSAFSISRRMASDLDGVSFCFAAHASILAANSGASRIDVTGVMPVGAGPRFFRITGIAFAMKTMYYKGASRARGSPLSPGPNHSSLRGANHG